MRITDPAPVTAATPEDAQSVESLLAQLSSSNRAFKRADWDAMLADTGTTMFAIRDQDRIVGITTLATYRIATGLQASIDEVVVLDTHRGLGLGEKLIRAAIIHAASLGVRKIDLTSRPSREAANRLYQRLGFERRETNVYRLTLPPD